MTSLGVGGVTPTGVSGAELVREPGLQFGQPGDRRPRQRGVAAGGPGEGGAHQPLGQQLPVRVAGVERDDVVRGRCAWRWRRPGCAPAVSAGPRSASRSRRAARSGRRARRSRRPGGSRSGPARSRSRSAFCTVTGLAWYCATRARVDGSRAPGGAVAIQSRSAATIRELLSSFMSRHSSATLIRPAAVSSTPVAGLLWGLLGVAAFSFTVPFTRVAVGGLSPLFIGSARAVVAAVLAVARAGPHAPAASARPAVGAARGGRRRGRRRLPAAHLVRAHHRPRQPRRRRHRAAARRDGDDGGPARPRASAGDVLGRRRRGRGGGDRLRLRAVGRVWGSCTGRTCCCSARSWPRPSATPRAGCSPASSAPGRPCPGRSSCAPR